MKSMRNMRDIFRTGICFLLMLTVGSLILGCGKEEEVSQEEKQEGIRLYYLNKEENGLKPIPYSLQNQEQPEESIKEILFLLSDTENKNTGQYKPSIYKGIIVNSVAIKDESAVIDFEANYQQLSADKEILMRSSIVKSLIQIDGVESVTFTVNGSSLIGSDGKAVGVMTDDSFVMSRDELYSQTEEVILYYANEKGDGLVEVKRDIEVTDNMPVETGMLLALIHEAGPEGSKNPLPASLVINQTQMYNNICYVDLSSDIEDIMPDIEERVKIYSMVNTLISRGTATQVQFTVDGEKRKSLNDIKDFDQPMTCDYSLSE